MEISIDLRKMIRNKNIMVSFLNYIKKEYDKSIINLWSIEDINFNKILLSLGFEKVMSKHVFGYKFFKNKNIQLQWLVQKNDSQKF